MSDENCTFQLIFPPEFDERALYEMPLKGWLDVLVQLDDGSRYQVEFIDPVRLGQELNDYVQRNLPCYAEPGLIVVPEVTLERVRETVQHLHGQGFFKHFKPVDS